MNNALSPRPRQPLLTPARLGVYFFLISAALFFLLPLYVMGITSIKPMSEIRLGNIFALPLEVTFAPSRLNIGEAEAVIERARALGAFRFNTGRLMRIGTAARLWDRMEPTEAQYRTFRQVLDRQQRAGADGLELCFEPFTIEDGLRGSLATPPATLLVLPNGWVKVAAALPEICADLRKVKLLDAWQAYRDAWRSDTVVSAVRRAVAEPSRHAQANTWQLLPAPSV